MAQISLALSLDATTAPARQRDERKGRDFGRKQSRIGACPRPPVVRICRSCSSAVMISKQGCTMCGGGHGERTEGENAQTEREENGSDPRANKTTKTEEGKPFLVVIPAFFFFFLASLLTDWSFVSTLLKEKEQTMTVVLPGMRNASTRKERSRQTEQQHLCAVGAHGRCVLLGPCFAPL
jgi:hypothetical protein